MHHGEHDGEPRILHAADRRVRNITDADADAIARALKNTIKKDLYEDLGRGLWGLVMKALITSLVAIAAYGAAHRGWL